MALAAAVLAAPVVAAETVRRIEVRSPVAIDRAELESLLVVRPGDPIGEGEVRRTLRNLRLSGVALGAEVWRRPVADGVALVVVLWPEVRVASVTVEGETALPRQRLLAAVPQRAGEPLREDRVLRGVYRLSEELEREGYLEARVRVAVSEPSPADRVTIVYRLEPGPRWLVGAVEIEGLAAAATPAEARGTLRLESGEPYRPRWLREDRERLERFLYGRGYGIAEVDEPSETRHDGRVDLRWRVRPGPRVELTVVGAERRALAKRGLLPFLGDAGYDEALLLQSLAQIRRDYQERGYYRVEVSHSEVRDGQRIALQLAIEPGRRYRLERVGFAGELSFPAERLERLMATERRRLLAPGSGRLVDEVLNEDLANLRSFYALEGFARAQIGPPVVEEDDDRLRVVVPIEEGPRRIVDSIAIEGLTVMPVEEALGGLPLAPGDGFHPFHVDAAVERLLLRLDERGYRGAIVAPEVTWPSEHRAAVRLRVLEGQPSLVESVVVRGNERTETPLVRRFLGIERGQPISSSALLEAQRALYGLGVFSSVRVRAPVHDGEFVAHSVQVEVEEGKSRSLSLGVGWDSEDGARGVFRVATVNLFGRLATLQLDGLVSDREQDLRLLYRQPYLGRWRVEARALAFVEEESRPSFEVMRRGVGVGLVRAVEPWRLGAYYNYRIVEEEVFEEVRLEREDTDARVASVTGTVLYDRRDDPIDPSRGWSAYLEAERAEPFLAADADFSKLFGQLTWIRPTPWGFSAALSLRGGRIFPHGGAPSGGEPIDAVPISELYFAGGRTSHRAFRRDELGVPGETLLIDDDGDPLPTGGGALVLANLDVRVPLVGELDGVLFADYGNVWREAADVDLSEFRPGVGVGLRYRLPFGPLRVEVGWKLDRERFEDPYVISVTLGNAF